MNIEVLCQEDFPNTIVTERFLHFDGFFYINSDCIFTENKIVRGQTYFDLVEFLDDGGILLRSVKFWTAILKNEILKIIIFDTKTNRVLHRTHPLKCDTIPCSWLLVEKDYFKNDLQDLDF